MKIQTNIRIKQVVAYVLLTLQALSYVSVLAEPGPPFNNPAELLGYSFGFNLFLIIAIMLLRNVRKLKKKLKRQEEEQLINSIGSSGIDNDFMN
ncbi:hypothetical protein [Polluticaenibacter yanchengensis]|uniref:CcmD family protein n=1 Tax=Polluticaenibacter yanchengensis TaxID=3014562 RepID=A0ABT4UNE9_9BACT|nr:hypothetical protein [Chitinophagaceae bacterium LY-5]